MLATILIVVYVIVCVALVVIVLLQSGKGEGMAGVFGGGGSQTIFGARTGDVLTKSTTVLAVLFMCLSLALALLSTRSEKSLSDEIARAAAQMPASAPASSGEPVSAEGAVPAPEGAAPVSDAGGPAAPAAPAAAVSPAL
jgi:preprotein translocase subunit SecG